MMSMINKLMMNEYGDGDDYNCNEYDDANDVVVDDDDDGINCSPSLS